MRAVATETMQVIFWRALIAGTLLHRAGPARPGRWRQGQVVPSPGRGPGASVGGVAGPGAEVVGTAPGLDQADLRLALHPAGPAERALPAGVAQLPRPLPVDAGPLIRE